LHFLFNFDAIQKLNLTLQNRDFLLIIHQLFYQINYISHCLSFTKKGCPFRGSPNVAKF